MFNRIKQLPAFCFYFSALMAVFWPYAMTIFIIVSFLPVLYVWDFNIIFNLNHLIHESGVLPQDLSQIFLIPGFLLFGFPILFCENGGSFQDCHANLFQQMINAFETPLGFIAWIVTFVIGVSLISCSIYCAKNMLNISWKDTGVFTAISIFCLSGYLLF